MRRLRLLLLAGTVTLMVAACGGGSKTTDNPPQNPPPQPPPTSGLDARPSNATCIAPARGPAAGAVDVADAFPNLPDVSQPTKVLVEPVPDPRWFVLEKTGRVRVFDPDNATSLSTFLDLSGVVRTASEAGLLGMAFHPDYPAVPEVFLSYVVTGPVVEARSVISRFILDNVDSPGAGTAEQVILEVDQFRSNHNGGDIAFGPDRLLYIGVGDGGGANDPEETGQDTTRLLGSFLRIDVTGTGADYNIPAGPQGNPFSGNAKCGPGLNAAACPEIYAWGFRNPWRTTASS